MFPTTHFLIRASIASSMFALALGLWSASAAMAQAPRDRDLLEQQKKLNDILAQRTEAEVREALVEAQEMASGTKAAERLKKTLAELENEKALPEKRRESLVRMLKDRIRVYEAAGDQAIQKEAEKAERRFIVIGKRNEEDRQAAEKDAVARTLRTIADLQKQGRNAEANRMLADLGKQYPDNSTVKTMSRTTSIADQLAADRKLKNDKTRGEIAAMRDVDRSSIPAVGDIEYPKNWKELTAKRSKQVPLTAKEQAIIKALNSTISADFKNSRFEDAMEYIQTFIGQPILLDKQALDEALVTYDTPVNAKFRTITVRTLLRHVLNGLGLTYVVKEETIQVTTAQRAREMLVTRTYYLGDFATGGMFGNAVRFGPGLSQLQMIQNVNQIMEQIQASVEPMSWQVNGGAGSITFHAPTMSLIVRQSAEVHGVLMGGGGLR